MPTPLPSPPATETAAGLTTSGVQRCICAECGTDAYLVPEMVRTSRLPGRADTTGWDVSYWCSSCGQFGGHLTSALPQGWMDRP